RAVPALGVDHAVAPADLARPPGVPRPPPGLRRLRGGPALPVLRHRADRPAGGTGAGERGPVLVTSATAPQAAPEWLLALAGPRRAEGGPATAAAAGRRGRPAVGGPDALRRDRWPA